MATDNSSTTPMPTIFIPHGGGPCFFMEPPFGPKDMWDKMGNYLRSIVADLPRRPKAVLAVSAHWECPRPTVMTSPAPSMLFDYYGFPEHTYRLEYPAPGSPELAARVQQLLADAGIASDSDHERGFDHGVFVPFLLMLPDADIPVVQLSLQRGLDPKQHLLIGKALASLRDEDVLIVGSGLSYHNLRHFFADIYQMDPAAQAFDNWLNDTVCHPNPVERNQRLINWSAAPGSRSCHPREEHLLPLMVAAGAADADPGSRPYNDHVMGKAVSGFQFG
ncbi:dioxygenase [Pokkaliibacter plantistimulans]|uniref:Dioxygenase n=1 Tax=Proteobacteria bacterium 228 TaxID=2083153 RepID=A0A2S5KQZ9_9PROT|nr:class III extradiol ring-cleavage dioxygenase [Pokkaliibacter plantistimulans]PPC77123.1 dioxygenase [Pokkaliibacter plantistimulans]